MRSDLTDLRLFLNVLDSGSITAGAARTSMTLASASERIRAMESALGLPLLTRGNRGVSATSAGLALLRHARLVLRQLELMHGDLADFSQGMYAQVRLLCSTCALDEPLFGALSSFLQSNPEISVDLEELSSSEIVAAVHQGTCDLGLVSDEVDLSGLETVPIADDPLVVVVAATHQLARRRRVSLADIIDQRFIGLAACPGLHDQIAHDAQQLGTRIHDRVRLRSLDAICRLVGTGAGIGIVPRSAATRAARQAGIKRISLDEPWAERRLVLCVRDMRHLASAARKLVAHMQNAAQALAPELDF